jgi:CRP/FNR family transcriptional regulator
VAHGPSIRAVPFDHVWPAGLATELLSERQREHLAGIATVRLIPPRAHVYREGERAESVYLISRGVIKSYREQRNGRQQVVAFMFPSDVIGLAVGGHYVNSTQALMPSTVYCLRVDVLKESFREDFALQFQFLSKVAHELRESQRQMIGLARRDASGKVAMFLERMQSNRAMQDGNGDGAARDAIWLPMTRADIANYLGLTQETLSRTAARLKRQGIVNFPDRHHVQILDRARLRKLADPI